MQDNESNGSCSSYHCGTPPCVIIHNTQITVWLPLSLPSIRRAPGQLYHCLTVCRPNVFVCDKYVTQVYQWTIRQLHFRPEWQVNICYCIVVTYQQITDRWHYECKVCKKLHNMQTSYIQSNTLINWNNHKTQFQGGCSVGAHCVSQWTIRSAKEEPKHVWVWQLDQQGQAGRNQTIRHPAPCLHQSTIPVAGC